MGVAQLARPSLGLFYVGTEKKHFHDTHKQKI